MDATTTVMPASTLFRRPGTADLLCCSSRKYLVQDTKSTPDRGDDVMTTYCSKGPTLGDHAVKPDLLAPGNGIFAVRVSNLERLRRFVSGRTDSITSVRVIVTARRVIGAGGNYSSGEVECFRPCAREAHRKFGRHNKIPLSSCETSANAAQPPLKPPPLKAPEK